MRSWTALKASLLAPVDNRHPERAPAWRRWWSPLSFFRSLSEDGPVAWHHNIACRHLLAHAAIARFIVATVSVWLAVSMQDLSVWLTVGLILLAIPASLSGVIYGAAWLVLEYDVYLRSRH
jgi:hypothetical protein